jgi:hypothetical protein
MSFVAGSRRSLLRQSPSAFILLKAQRPGRDVRPDCQRCSMSIRSGLAVAASFMVAALPAGAQAAAAAEAKTAAAVRAADDAWGAAEMRGDAAFVDRLLLPAYRSIGPDGKVTTKAAIVEHARARRGATDAVAQVAAWKAAHPVRAEVAITGDTAVLTWVSTKPGSGEPVASCDIFVYRDGRWHAIYSQHTSAGV